MNSTLLTQANDLEIVAAMSRGDQRAAAALYDRHSATLYALALRIVGEGADAEEIVLEAFTQAWKDATRYDASRATVAGWLTTIARTRALDLVRSRGRRLRTMEVAARESADVPVGMSTTAGDVSDQLEVAEQRVAIAGAMSELPVPQRQVIELSFFEGLTHQEIAERLSEPLGTVKTRIRLGMQKLRDHLSPLARTRAS